MPSYNEWPLPLNPPIAYGVYLHSLAPVRPKDTSVYYTKYILGIIGELNVATAQGREWTFPPQLYTSSMKGGPIGLVNLERGRDPGSLWCVLEEHHGALIEFRPRNGLFTRFTTKAPGAPLVRPKDLKFDGKGNLWFIGGTMTSNVSTSTISRFELATRTTTSWEVPTRAMVNLSSLHPNRAGSKVWVSSVAPIGSATTQWIGCLDVPSGVLTCFSPDPYVHQPRSIDIVLVENQRPASVWFTAASSRNVNAVMPAIYRLDLTSNVFYRHVTDPMTSLPLFLAIDPGGTAWITDIGRNSIVSCSPRRDCGTVRFQSSNFQLKRSNVRLLSKDYPAEPIAFTSKPRSDSVTTANYSCAEEYHAAAMSQPDRLQLQLPGTAPNLRLFFVCFGANKIGMLEP